jgi:anthranilate/para-aminobenzoate synthase component I
LASEPIKGTRPRAEDPEEDRRLAEELAADEKDRAENIMIADLMRNDLAKVCGDGSIREEAICALRSLPHVHHLYSRIEGRLKDGLGFTEALSAAFPCGSITGAPKLAAMKVIADLEGEGRGPYCGTIFMRTRNVGVASVAIRTAVLDHDEKTLQVRSGGGVTILSDPAAEYDEADAKSYLFKSLIT